ncbi:Phosphoglycerate mutase family protein [Quillaja saponaria]|uniref:Phosphoglycerate mutase family protein n=1 Tax=Quillaja saponaria TaxID=32244 RepID=A0AAD7L4P7_QUISA|nr:Phosphoglycerate mutase family protein [Quillaja saponaria]
MDSSGTTNQQNQQVPDFYQNVVVMRHGDRIDNFEPLWVSTAARPWDPPLIEEGRVRAFCAGRKLRTGLGFPIHRVFVSPFIRCIQTASEVISALSANEDHPGAVIGDGIPIDSSKLKASVEYGLCEMLNREAIRLDLVPKDGNWGFDFEECEALLPAGTVDDKVERVYKEARKTKFSYVSIENLSETTYSYICKTIISDFLFFFLFMRNSSFQSGKKPASESRSRYARIFKDLADKYPTENLLLVTHGEGIGVAVSAFKEDVTVYEVNYCAYAELKRPIFKKNKSFVAGDFTVVTKSGQTGITYCPTSALTSNASLTSI